jgi:hypothetical protein
VDIMPLNFKAIDSPFANIRSAAGDSTDTGRFEADSFDVMFGNAAIKHLCTRENH